ncbi:mechanosensitive ion channel domain-containing protein [Comamonas terrae]|uniref:Mechanosensitive ion channel domain-containing protein n=1 Tax=Comamonas terrae TaxID=673548 RepID=A0ABW5UUQ8_9BURK|nr:mechanosensitive ion channel domain-containing protein [Comamonas terrae]
MRPAESSVRPPLPPRLAGIAARRRHGGPFMAAWLLWLACVLLPLAAGAAPALPQTGTLGALQAGLGNGSSASEERHTAIQAQLDAADAANKEADGFAQELDSLRAKVQAQVPAMPATPNDEELAGQLARWKERVPANASQEVLERLLAEEREAIAALKTGIEKTAADQVNLVSQPSQVDMATLRQRVQQSAEPVTAEPGEPPALTQARQLRRNAEHRRATLELALRQEEQSTTETRQRLLDAQQQSQRRELLERTPRVAWLNQLIAERSRQRLEQQAQEAAHTAAQIGATDPANRELAQQNATLAAQILDYTNRLAQERQTLAGDEYRRDQLAAALRDTQARLRLGGTGAAVGQWLWKQWVALPTDTAVKARRKDLQRRLAELRLALFNSSEWRAQLNSAVETGTASAQRITLQNRQVTLVDQLQPVLLRRIAVLEQTDEVLQSALRSSSELLQVMDKELLWFPSHRPMDRTWLGEWGATLQGEPSAVRPSPWTTLHALGASMREAPLDYGAVAVIVVLLLGLRRRASRQLHAVAQRVGNFAQDHFGLSLVALGWSLLYALPWSVATAGLGGLMQASETHGAALEPLGRTLGQLSDFIFVATLLNALFRPGGLALAHFGWEPERVQALRQLIRRATWLIVPTELLGGLAFFSHNDIAISTWGRLSILVMSLGLAWMTWRYLRHSALPRQQGFRWSQWLAVLLLVLLAVVVAGIAMGYVYTATEVIQALLSSFVFLAASEVVVALLRRWLLLGERRLALRRLREAAMQGPAATSEAGKAPPPDEARQMALVTVSAQAHRLLGLLQQVLVALSLLYSWSQVLPALLRFEGVVLWYTTNTGADGVPHSAPVSLMDVLLSALILLLTVSLTRNLPGLMEVMLSTSLRISNSARYTAATLARYVITIAGAISAFSLLGLRWGQLQWMAAALTVGLGFGLQEIFANFVSGLILLVERPFRVGDVITINTLDGTVTRIRTRATTVLDFDNKEIVIPNKTFITGQVTNWTLSDDVTRLVIDIAVAHGNDPARVRDMLLAIANEHPQVLRDPAPNCWFMALEGNGQKFELRAYVGAVGDRLQVRNDLNRRINEQLTAAGIAIAFPQMDIHVRDLPTEPASRPYRPQQRD